jgi:type I restriction enzyme S subunit
MVPNGWNETKLGDVIKHQKGYAFKSESYKKDGIRIIRISDTSRNSIHDKSPVYLAEDASESLANYKLREDDIILSTVGSRPHLLDSMVGKAVKLRKQDNGALLNQNLVKVSPKPNLITNDYLFSMLTKSRFIYFISTLVRGNANQVSITLAELFSYKFLLPPYDEQRTIAKILSTWDKAISSTERLINNSKQQKKALMQQLLTGKKRLLDESGKPFEGEWEEVKLGQITEFIKDGTHGTHKRYETGVPMLSAANITKNHKICFEGAPFISEVDYQKIHAKYEISVGDILLTVVGTLGRVAIVEKKERFTLQRSVAIIRASDGVDNRFLMQLFSSNDFNHLLVRKSNSTAQAGVYLGELAKIKILLPAIEEQEKIASVLVNADQETELLEQQLADLKQEKKALMQQLLTGKKRVKI